jgi:Mg/Co/Ni transporter MgtE
VGAVPLARIVLADSTTSMLSLIQEPLVFSREAANDNEFAELFDKYNLLTLPVVNEHNKLTGVITSDEVISILRAKL